MEIIEKIQQYTGLSPSIFPYIIFGFGLISFAVMLWLRRMKLSHEAASSLLSKQRDPLTQAELDAVMNEIANHGKLAAAQRELNEIIEQYGMQNLKKGHAYFLLAKYIYGNIPENEKAPSF